MVKKITSTYSFTITKYSPPNTPTRMNDNTTLMRQWIDQLNKASEAYYNGQGELMTDYEWDALFDKLKEMERQTGITLEGSPTAKVSEDNITGAEGGTRICGPLAGQDEKHGRTGKMGRRAPRLALVETRRTDAGGDLRQRPPNEGGHARQRTHGHQHHAPRPRHRGHSPRNRRQRARGGARRSRHFLSGLRNLQHGERRGVCQPQKPSPLARSR